MLPNPVFGAVLSDQERKIVADVQGQIPLSIQMTEEAIAVISKGWNGMSAQQQALFLDIFDPGDTGEIDDAYLREVASNYEKILAKLKKDMRIKYVTDSEKCTALSAAPPHHFQAETTDRQRMEPSPIAVLCRAQRRYLPDGHASSP